MPIFDTIEKHPEDPILGLAIAFRENQHPSKVNLGIGAYKNSEGQPQVLASVRKAEALLLEQHLNKEYLPIQGDPIFIRETLKVVFGKNSPLLSANAIFGAQTLGGTGALRIGAEFLARNGISQTIFLSDPTWPNHISILSKAGMKIDSFPYYDDRQRSIHFSAMCDAIRSMPPMSTILLQPCCHNPTGMDPTFEQWLELSDLIKSKNLIPFFDLAYQGFDQGLEEDASVVRHYAKEGHHMLVASSFSKNFGLYGERVGLLSIVTPDATKADHVGSQVKQIIRGNYSMPPLQGERIVTTILTSSDLYNEWIHEVQNMRDRIDEMRKTLIAGLHAQCGDSQFDYLAQQRGMFSYSGLNAQQVHILKKQYGIFMPSSGRINVAGLNPQNIDYVINSILSVLEI